jgi:protein ImuB
MNFAALRVRQFALVAVLRGEAALQGRPVALIAGEGRRAVVLETNPEAARIAPGLAVPLATARCPGLQLRERNPEAEVEAQRILLAAAFRLSPRVEPTAAGCCTVDLQGADPQRTEAEMHRQVLELQPLGLPLRIGAGDTPLLARYAAACAEPVLIVRQREEFLRPLPLHLAEPSPEQALVLESWGIRTLGQLTALPKAGIGDRLGPGGVALWERAHGESPPVLRLTEPVRTFAAAWSCEPPVETVEPLLFRLRRYAERIALELRSVHLVADVLALTLLLENETHHRRRFRLPEPGADPDLWLRVLQTHLETVRLAERVIGVELVASPTRPQTRQEGLFDTGLVDPNSFWENLARLAALIGHDRVGTPVWIDSHAPDAFRLERPAATLPAPEAAPLHPARGGLLRRFRPPLEARVTWEDDRPVFIAGAVRGAVVDCAGPWVLGGDWWKPEGWTSESWQIELEGGGLYQLARIRGDWWIEGVLD